MKFKANNTDRDSLKIIALGGFGSVTQNLFVYEYQDNILIVDCGIGFKEEEGKEGLVIPDLSYLLQNRKKLGELFLLMVMRIILVRCLIFFLKFKEIFLSMRHV